MGLTTTAAKNILRTVQDDRPILWEQGLSEALIRLLSSCLKNTWLVLPEDQGDVQISTGLGTPQGSSLSGLLFILYQQRIHGLINQFLHERGVALVLPAPSSSTYDMQDSTEVIFPALAYHDDTLVLMKADTAADL
eukprot:4440885-Amphidinium_carterae.1